MVSVISPSHWEWLGRTETHPEALNFQWQRVKELKIKGSWVNRIPTVIHSVPSAVRWSVWFIRPSSKGQGEKAPVLVHEWLEQKRRDQVRSEKKTTDVTNPKKAHTWDNRGRRQLRRKTRSQRGKQDAHKANPPQEEVLWRGWPVDMLQRGPSVPSPGLPSRPRLPVRSCFPVREIQWPYFLIFKKSVYNPAYR